MDDEGQLNEYIKALRNAILSITVLSVVAFITLEPKIEVAERYSTYARLVVEFAILDTVSQVRPSVFLEYDGGLGAIDSKDLGVDVPDFLFLAQARYALPNLFHENYCDDRSPITHSFGNWDITIDPIECTTVLPPNLDDLENLDHFTSGEGPFKEEAFLEHINAMDVEDQSGELEAETARERFKFQDEGPYELRLIATRGSERHKLRIDNIFGFSDRSCREGGGGKARLYRSDAVLERSDDPWDCDLGGVVQSNIAFDLEAILAEYQGFAYKQESRTPLQYHQYGNALAKDLNADTESLPFVPVGIRASWFLVACYALIIILLTWAIYLLSEIPRRRLILPTVPSIYGLIAKFGALAKKDGLFSLASVIALIVAISRLACYLIPAMVLILLLSLKQSAGILDGIEVFGVTSPIEIGITVLIFSLGITAANLDFRIVYRVWLSVLT